MSSEGILSYQQARWGHEKSALMQHIDAIKSVLERLDTQRGVQGSACKCLEVAQSDAGIASKASF
jgi:hypothetical protein